MPQPSIVALIPARQGSKRVQGKNIRVLNGHPLIAYTIAAATESGVFNSIIVSTDSEHIAAICRHYGAEVPFFRPPELARDHPWAVDALNYLDRRLSGGATEPCPLPELLEAVCQHHPDLTVAVFHDGLRQLHQRRAIRLCPVEDLEGLSRPEIALLEGEVVLYHVER